jgi:endonuclease G
MAIFSELLETAKRFDHWSTLQSQVSRAGDPADRQMQAARLRFSSLEQLHVDPGVFLEAVLEGNDLMPIRYFETGKLASRPVGRIHFDLGPRIGQGFATGFLVAPGLLLTNNHVLPSADVALAASVTFDAEDGLDGLPRPPHVFRLDPKGGYLADKFLDFCFVAVSPRSTEGRSLADFGYLRLHGATGKIVRDEYATIIQHPRGRQKQVAARNNKIVVYVYDQELTTKQAEDNNHLYYSTDTLPGSSGAPVFSDQWYVVALHRRGVPAVGTNDKGEAVVLRRDDTPARPDDPDETIRYIANEGVRVSRIMKRLKALSRVGDATHKLTASQIVEKIQATLVDPQAGPFSVPTASINRLSGSGDSALGDEALEVVRRSLAVFEDAAGFDEAFLGVRVRLPKLSTELRKAAARRIDDPTQMLLPFRHFSSVVHAKRRLPIFSAVNIDGGAVNTSRKPARPTWSYDPRLDETQQPDDSIFSALVQRGHMAAREFVWWGDDDEAREADVHSFTLSNVCPQIGRFNGNLEWFKLERLVIGTAKAKGQRVNCFMGPIFARNDPLYDDLRGDGSTAEFNTGIRMPLRFWYVLAWREGNALKHRCFMLDQGDDIRDAGPLEFDFEAPATVKEVTIAEVSRLTKLSFVDLQ